MDRIYPFLVRQAKNVCFGVRQNFSDELCAVRGQGDCRWPPAPLAPALLPRTALDGPRRPQQSRVTSSGFRLHKKQELPLSRAGSSSLQWGGLEAGGRQGKQPTQSTELGVEGARPGEIDAAGPTRPRCCELVNTRFWKHEQRPPLGREWQQ